MEIWSLFDPWREHHPNMAVMENPVAPKFSRPVRLLNSFPKNFSRKANNSEVA